MENEVEIKKRYHQVRHAINLACQKVDRSESGVRLLAVSKGQSVEAIKCLYALGQRDFGENYIDEMLQKKNILAKSCPDIKWHFIGNLQTNKLAKIAQADLVQSISSVKQAVLLSRFCDSDNPLPVFVQIKLEQDVSRCGVNLAETKTLLVALKQINSICVKGLMTILPLNEESNPVVGFNKVKHLLDKLQTSVDVNLTELSMGMSSDFPEAIAAGSTWVRIGTLLFGKRKS